MPKTKLGKWSIGLFGFAVLCFIFTNIVASLGQTGGKRFQDNLLISIPMLLLAICGVSSFIVGLLGIIKSQERSALVYIITFLGFLLTLLIIGELLFFE